MACSRLGPPASPAGYRRAPDGSIGSTCEALYLAPDEHIYGLGEKFLPPDRRGQRVESWNFNTWGATNERAYKNVPFFVSSRGYGVFVNPAGTIARLRERGVRVCLWVQPWIPAESDQFAAGLEAGAFAKRADGSPYLYDPTIPGRPPRPSGIVDFSNVRLAGQTGSTTQRVAGPTIVQL
jgi:alpha-glucosidase (family GH31 glycosyl hydrolase)